ncbi:ExeM/NucH family extracellular endonuclease [Endozoicomonas gorgoniicola]|uniref:ExeM/NucH family extracellular endonuclease n=1 Tax=Endozoicomonas gorgoniicola TaxID=1234144 RepID=A0ABT3MX35_9GAMM|nr:ExeM/NucH family extracellular endonuclease [Endozoicomonas gorgoniicola]MCW7553943.1 ExeM/NucH family extracellular endonuclease [Endozoicomonas gorgoniicola]
MFRLFSYDILLSGSLLAALAQPPAIAQVPYRIHDVQGSGGESPHKGERVSIEGILTGFYSKGRKSPYGFFLQEPKEREDDDDKTSEGVFVYFPKEWEQVKQNDLVQVNGTVKEYYGETQISKIEGNAIIKPAGEHSFTVSTPKIPAERDFQSGEMERNEGMTVVVDGVITRSYGYDYDAFRNNMVLAKSLQFNPTQKYRPTSVEAEALVKTNAKNRIVLEESGGQIKGEIGYYPQFNPQTYPLRVSSQVRDIKGILAYAYRKYFLVMNEAWGDNNVQQPDNDSLIRAPKPASRKNNDDLRIAGFNLLNFFTDAMVEGAPQTTYAGGNRGAKTIAEGVLQRQKLAEAIRLMDADAIGFLEVGNNGKTDKSSIANLVRYLNSRQPDKNLHYQYVYPEGDSSMGTDAISVGLIYRPAFLKASGSPVLLPMPREVKVELETDEGSSIIGQRSTLIQKFCRKDQDDFCFTLAVNHFKSKGCRGCVDDPVDEKGKSYGGIQACCNNLRVSAAYWLGEYFKTHTNPEEDSVLLIGDFNAYAQEDPVYLLTASEIDESENVKTSSSAKVEGSEGEIPLGKVLTEGYGYKSLLTEGDTFSYSYGGALGSLDHALASAGLEEKVVQAFDWHINSLENSLFEYPDKYSGDLPKVPGQYSSSDHDPVIIDIRR